MQPQPSGGLNSSDNTSSARKRLSPNDKAHALASPSSTVVVSKLPSFPSSRASTFSSRSRSQGSSAGLSGLLRSGLDLATHSNTSSTAANSSANSSLGFGSMHRRWTTDAEASSPVAKARGKANAGLGRVRHTADVPSTKASGLAGRRTISLEARAGPVDQAQPAPKGPSQDGNSPAPSSNSNGAGSGESGEAEVPIILPDTPTASSAADVMQSADDDLDPDTVRVKSHEEASTRGNPDMVLKWDTQQAMKPPAFDQDDHVRSDDSSLDIAVVSRGGRLNSTWKKENQDKFLLQLDREDGWSVMGVYDGHGMWGGKVASIVRDGMRQAMKSVDGRKMNGSDPEAALRDAYDQAEAELDRCALDLTRSGTTAVLSIVAQDWIATAWAGDSRMVLGRQVSDGEGASYVQALELTEDHKPDNPVECKRIHEAGGRVDRLVSERTKEPVGPFRVYLQYSWSPGLACSRAFGDKMAVEVGVTYKPDVVIHKRQPEDQWLIVASDGVWELVSSQEAIDIVAQYPDDVEQGVAKLLQISRQRWAAIQGGRTCDDITAIVTKLNAKTSGTERAEAADATAANA